jgi:4a-hydroxytetrahydrobiopterin dehydratase
MEKGMNEAKVEKTYSETEISARLQAFHPQWTYANGTIRRTYKTSGWKATLMVVNVIGHICEAAWHHPELLISYASIEIALSTHSANGITDKDFELAKKIEEIVFWQPGKEQGALEGIPAKLKSAAYIDYSI